MTKAKILIVEDQAIVGLDIKSALQKLNFEVIGAVTNYTDAINSIQKDSPNIIIMDINLDNSKDGIETATVAKQINPDIAIIYLTAFADDTTIHRAAHTDPVGYLVKPFKYYKRIIKKV
jgi:DNA-binding NarL/FixJ family response regulator